VGHAVTPAPRTLAIVASRVLLLLLIPSGRALPGLPRELPDDTWGLVVRAVADAFAAPPGAMGLLLSCVLSSVGIVRFHELARAVLPTPVAERALWALLLWPGTALLALPGAAAAVLVLSVESITAIENGRLARAGVWAAAASLLWPPASALALPLLRERSRLAPGLGSAFVLLLPVLAGVGSLLLGRPAAPADGWTGPLLLFSLGLVRIDAGWLLWASAASVAAALGMGVSPGVVALGFTPGSLLAFPAFIALARLFLTPTRQRAWQLGLLSLGLAQLWILTRGA
jgi:hypothetical protein